MNYFLRSPFLGQRSVLPIDEERFVRLRRSKLALDEALSLEEKYEMILVNYIEFEDQVFSSTLISSVRSSLDLVDMFDLRIRLSVRITNLLSAARLYDDTLVSHVGICISDTASATRTVARLRASALRDNPNYEFMEQLRNHSQHEGTPIHNYSIGGAWTEIDGEDVLEHYLQFHASKEKLLKNPQFERSALKRMPDVIDLMKASRSYIESISAIHSEVRKAIAGSLVTARQDIENALAEYEKLVSERVPVLSGISQDADGTEDRVDLFLDWDDVRKKLDRRSPRLSNLSKRHVSSRTRPVKN